MRMIRFPQSKAVPTRRAALPVPAHTRFGCIMELVCPSCETRFNVPDQAIGASGRTVKCSQCDHVWHAHANDAGKIPPAPAPESALESPAPAVTPAPIRTEPTPAAVRDSDAPPPDRTEELPPVWDRPHPASEFDETPTREKRPWGWIIVGLALLLAVAATYVLRNEIASAIPASKRLYTLAGIPLHQTGEGLDFIELQSKSDTKDGELVLTVSGFIKNRTDLTLDVPQIKVTVVDKADEPVAEFVRPPPQPAIDPRDLMRFDYEFTSPNTSAERLDIKVRFGDGTGS